MNALLIAFAVLAQADGPTMNQVLARAQAYVQQWQTLLSGVVAEETYAQDARTFRTSTMTTTSRALSGHRDLKSDLLLVKPEGGDRWVQFRDVFEVDGKSVRDRSERLLDLFVRPTASTRSMAERIMAESSRYNMGGVERNINVPIFTLTVLLPENIGRFTFTRATRTTPELLKNRPPEAAWVVEFTERRKQTMIRTTGDGDVPSSGRLWIDPESGRVLMTELVADLASMHATIDVAYDAGPFPSVLVPSEMRERYDIRRPDSRVEGVATYGRFRQFQVTVDEQLAPVKK